jgi:hypothetical protein
MMSVHTASTARALRLAALYSSTSGAGLSNRGAAPAQLVQALQHGLGDPARPWCGAYPVEAMADVGAA